MFMNQIKTRATLHGQRKQLFAVQGKRGREALGGETMAVESKYALPRVMTVKELSEYLRVHPSTIYKLLRRGELPGFRIGTDWRFNAEVIDQWCLERNMKGSDAPTRN
jgi:excisionase family DNA binding protein